MIVVLKGTIRNIFYEKLRNLTPRLTAELGLMLVEIEGVVT